MANFEKRRPDALHGLPPGWKREEVVRRKGLSAGKTDVFYFSPDGQKVRTKAQLVRMLGDKVELSGFDFRTGRTVQINVHRRLRQDANLILPIRQTASIFKQPVTIVSNHKDSKTRTDLKHGPQEQPRQLFWEKRLQGLFACDGNGETLALLQLPSNIRGVAPELISGTNLLHGIAASLHLGSQPVSGQATALAVIQRNPSVNINVEQPLMEPAVITEHDLQKQELRVQDARRRLARAMALSDSSVHETIEV